MKKVKSKWVVATVFTAMVGISAFAPMEASAAEWNARTPQQIQITDRSHYDIVWGDTLWAISEASNVSVEALVEINHIANRDLILAGNYLVIEGNVVSVTQQNGQTDSFKVEGNTVTPVETPAKPVVNQENTISKNETVAETPKTPATQAPVVKDEAPVVVAPEVKPEVKPETKPETPVVTPDEKPEVDNEESGNFAPDAETPDAETPDVDVPVTPEPEAPEAPEAPVVPDAPVENVPGAETPEEVPMTPIEPSTPVVPEETPEEVPMTPIEPAPETKPEEKPEVPMTPIGPSYPIQSLYEQLSFYFMDTGYDFEVYDDEAGTISIGYDSGVGSTNQNDIDNYEAIRADALAKMQSMGLSYEIIDGNDWFMITVNY